MPTYEYRCSACGRQVEVMHGIYDQGPTICQSCGGVMRKALSSPAIHFKGSGWAKKDAQAASRSKVGAAPKEAGTSSTDTATTSTTTSGSGSSSERKPEGGTTGAAGKPATTVSTSD